jgi:hypothetical protein
VLGGSGDPRLRRTGPSSRQRFCVPAPQAVLGATGAPPSDRTRSTHPTTLVRCLFPSWMSNTEQRRHGDASCLPLCDEPSSQASGACHAVGAVPQTDRRPGGCFPLN